MNNQEGEFEHKVKFESEESLINYVSKEKEPAELYTRKNSRQFNEKPLQDEYFDFKSIKQEEIHIKMEHEEEDEFGIEYSVPESDLSNTSYKCRYCHMDLSLEKYKNSHEITCSLENNKNIIEGRPCDLHTGQYFLKSEFIMSEEIGIKIENKEEKAPYNAESEAVECKNSPRPINKTDFIPISANSRCSNLEDPPVFKCFNCSYQTHQKPNIARHVLTHMPKTLKCPCCPYKTTLKDSFERHKVVHASKEEVNLYKCPKCPLTTKWKNALTRHLVTHKKPNEVIWHQCSECPFKTRHRNSLSNHMVIHRKDHPTLKCTLCSYESLRKGDLQIHLQLVHGPKDVPLLGCPEESCSFKTRRKMYLERHIVVVHKCKRFFKCSKCSYETKYGQLFKAHELKHENPDKWFSCHLCPFKTTRRSALRKHALVHKSDSEVKWFKCSECSFKTKHGSNMKKHKLRHT